MEEVLGRYRVQSELMSRKETFQQMPLFPGTVEPETEPPEAKPEILGDPPARKTEKPILENFCPDHHRVLGPGAFLVHPSASEGFCKRRKEPARPGDFERRKDRTESAAASAVAEGNRRAPVKEKTRITGDRTKKVYYLPGMKGAEKVSPVHRVEFDSEGEASKAGYRRAPP